MDVIKNTEGKVVSRSKNLLLFQQYERKFNTRPTVVTLSRDKVNISEGILSVVYPNGDHAEVKFASYTVMVKWAKRKNNWRGHVTINVND